MNGSKLVSVVLCMVLVLLFATVSLQLSPSSSGVSVLKSPFNKAYNLSNDSGVAHFPMVATSGSRVYVAWTEGSRGIMFRASLNNGSSWNPPISSPPLQISTGAGVANYPVLTANGSYVYVAWSQSIGGALQVMFSSSSNNGSSFSTPMQLTHTGGITPVIAAWGNLVYVAWASPSIGGSFVNSSSDTGLHWTNPCFQINAKNHEPQLGDYGTHVYATGDGAQAEGQYTGSGFSWK